MTESELEQEMLTWLISVGYTALNARELESNDDRLYRENNATVLLINELRAALQRLNPHIPATALADALRQIVDIDVPDQLGANRAMQPYDTPGAVRAFLDHWKPDVAVWTESELWPRMMRETKGAGIPMLLINARVSEKTAAQWQNWPKTAAALLGSFECILAQEALTAALIESLGLRNVRFSGSMKQEVRPPEADPQALNALEAAIGGRDAWLAASTHPGEEALAAEAHRLAGEALMFLAPRHPERGAALAAELRADGFTVAQRSLGEPLRPETQIYLADTLGEMGLWYRLAGRCFVGGSVTPMGGHNPYEPAALGCAILAGRQVFNFREPYEALSEAGGFLAVETAEELAEGLALLRDETRRARQASAAKACLAGQTGATEMALSEILARL